MNTTKLKTFLGSCFCLLLIATSVPGNAVEVERPDLDVAIEGWAVEGGREIPILSFNGVQVPDELYTDIRPENVIYDGDGSVRFQLSHSGPMSRQVFANVHRIEQDNGYTRSVITNIADGQQTEYLTETSQLSVIKPADKSGGSDLLADLKIIDDQNTECPYCIYIAGLVISEAMCAATTSLAYHQCRYTCEYLGGVKSFKSGICGVVNSECVCWVAPRRVADEL